jgi:hypothetical protein
MGEIRLFFRLILIAALPVAGIGCERMICAQEPMIPTLRGNITTVDTSGGFDVAGYHVIVGANTEFYVLQGPKKDPAALRSEIQVGTYVQVIGDKDRHDRTVVAHQVKVRSEDRTVNGFGVIDRMIAAGPQPVFRADGYVIRVAADALVHFSGGLAGVEEVGTGTWVHFQARPNNSGELVATRVGFVKPKLHKAKNEPASFAQVTTFPPGSIIDFDGSFNTNRAKKKPEDTPGGQCGWYPVIDVPSVQENVRRIGMRLIPRYQLNLPDDSSEKISFRFYVVEEKDIRSDLSCHEGLVLIPASVINRIQGQDQLAAVIADGIAASLQRQHARIGMDLDMAGAAEMAAALALVAGGAGGAAFIPEAMLRHEILRKMEDQRGRVALGLMADAGYDPWQAPEAWRLLEPKQLPRDMSRLKYPDRAGYLLEILAMQYKRPAATAASAQAEKTTTNQN